MERPKWNNEKFQALINRASNEFYYGGIVKGKVRVFEGRYEIPANSHEDACKILCLAYEIDDKEDVMGLKEFYEWEKSDTARAVKEADKILEEKLLLP